MVRLIPALFLVLAASACAKTAATPEGRDSDVAPTSPTGQTSTQQSDWAAIEQLEAQAKAMAKADGCSATSDCSTGAVGRKACGSPRYYLTYCRKTTDVTALNAKLEEIVKAETAYNTKYNVVSTCEMRVPPAVEAVGGSCQAK